MKKQNALFAVLGLFLLASVVYAGTATAISSPTSGELIQDTNASSVFTFISTSYNSSNCSSFLDGVTVHASTEVMNNTPTTWDMGDLGYAPVSHNTTVLCTNSSTTMSSIIFKYIPHYGIENILNISFDLTGTIFLALIAFASAIVGIGILILLVKSVEKLFPQLYKMFGRHKK